MVLEEGIGTIETSDGRELTYRFTPAMISKGSPLLVILSARGSKIPSKYNHKDWNVLSLVDTFGLEADASAYLGEEGDFFIRDMVLDLIQSAIDQCECNPKENLYFYASSIGAFAAIMYGILFEARAVHANAPIIKTHGTTAYWKAYKERIDFVIPTEMKEIVESDMVRFMRAHKHKDLPTFFLCDNIYQTEPWLQNFLQEQTMYFANACLEGGVDLYLEHLPGEGHTINHSLAEVIDLFAKHTPPKLVNILDFIDIETIVSGKTLKVNCTFAKEYPHEGDEQYAYYLDHKGKKVKQRWYEPDPHAEFILEDEFDLANLAVRGFIRDNSGNKVIKSVPVVQSDNG